MTPALMTRGRSLVTVDDQHRARGVLGDVRADRAEQQSGEAAVAAAADDDHGCALALVEEYLGGASLADHEVHVGRRVLTEGGLSGLGEHSLDICGRIPVRRDGGPAESGRVLPRHHYLQPGGEQRSVE